jgi:hypothetical protein
MANRELKRRQVEELYRRLETFKPAQTDEEAFSLITQLMREVGDELTDDPYDPTKWKEHDRIYPPQIDREQVPSGIEGARLFRTVAHEVIIGLNGAIAVRKRGTFEVEFAKAGHDGKRIAL